VLNTVSNEEIAAAAATRAESPMEQRRSPNKRKGWQQREKLYDVIRRCLVSILNSKGSIFALS